MLAEVSELCLLTHQYQKSVQCYKQILFNDHNITDDTLWHYIIGNCNTGKMRVELSGVMLFSFIVKFIGKDDSHNQQKTPISKKLCQDICHRYSSNCDGMLRKDDLWGIIKPLHMSHIESIVKCRKNKRKLSECPQLHYKSRDALISILLELSEYQRSAQMMRKNIAERFQSQQLENSQFFLKTVDADHLQAYVSEYTVDLKIFDCQKILSHILNSVKENKQKHFYKFFIPLYTKSPQIHQYNPNQKYVVNSMNEEIKNELAYKRAFPSYKEKEDGNQFSHCYESSKKWNYGKFYKRNNKPLYLQ